MTYRVSDIPDQTDKTIIVTGANAGLGYETTLALASRNANVILACRNKEKAISAMQKIKRRSPNANLDFIQLDLSDLKSVRLFATKFLKKHDRLDGLINNAGIMIPPYSQTKDGFESQMGANYFGHFLLTGLLLERLQETPNSRIVSLSSLAHIKGEIKFDDIHWQKSYSKMPAYQQSKLACLMFALELQRRLDRTNSSTISVAAHPGVSPTELSRHIPKLLYYSFLPTVAMISHKPKFGALPILMAATQEDVAGGDYYGPTGFKGMKGQPGHAQIAGRAKNEENAARLWEISEQLTNFKYPI